MEAGHQGQRVNTSDPVQGSLQEVTLRRVKALAPLLHIRLYLQSRDSKIKVLNFQGRNQRALTNKHGDLLDEGTVFCASRFFFFGRVSLNTWQQKYQVILEGIGDLGPELDSCPEFQIYLISSLNIQNRALILLYGHPIRQ